MPFINRERLLLLIMFPIPEIHLGNEQEVKTLSSFIHQMNQDFGVYKQMKSYFSLKSDQVECRKLQFLLLWYQFDKYVTGKYKYLCPEDEKNFMNMIDEQSSFFKCIPTCQGLALAFYLKTKRIETASKQASKIGCKNAYEWTILPFTKLAEQLCMWAWIPHLFWQKTWRY